MVAAGTGATVGITLWIVADGRCEPANFPSFQIQDSELVWDWSQSDSNYRTLEQQKEAAAGNATWEVQASLDLVTANVQSQITEAAQYGFVPGGGSSSGGSSSGGVGAVGGDNYAPIPASGTDPGETADQVMQDDLTVLFTGIASGFRLTRLRADLAHAALANDLQLQAAADQSTVTNLHVATQSANGPLCPVYQGCQVVGTGVYDPTASNNRGSGCSIPAVEHMGWGDTAILGGMSGLLVLSAVRARRRRAKT